MLARDKVPEVREAVVPHHMLPENVIAQLLFDFDLGVMQAASHELLRPILTRSGERAPV